jgi:hypothetical protein
MPRLILLLSLLLSAPTFAQPMPDHPAGGMHTMPMGKSHAMPTQGGQAAFAAIQEIVEIFEADPKADWTKVNIEALRQHLIDMDNVTLHAEVTSEAIDGGMRFTVNGAGTVKTSIQRMASAHAMTMQGGEAWQFASVDTDVGVILTVTAPSQDAAKLKALGFIGVMTRGMHHQMHHLMIARGENPHQ